MKVYIVYRLVGRLGISEVVGVFSTLEKAQDAVRRLAETQYSHDMKYTTIDEYIEDNFEIEKWFVDTQTLRGE